jgi:CRP/FNR family transcriptional regulator
MQNSFVADCSLTQALEKRSIPVPCSKGQVLFKQGEAPLGLYILRNGKASLVMKDESGAEVMHLTIGAGSILGVPAVVTKQPYTLSALAGPGAEVCFIGLRDFEDLMQAEPRLFPLVLSVLASEVRSARIALTGVMTKLRRRPSGASVPVLAR